MFIPKFEHELNNELFDKALTKFMKALETEEGKKFITHLTKAFIHSGTVHEVTEAESEFVKCDVTHAKLCTVKSMNAFQAVVKLRISQFTKLEGESDEQYEKRQSAYFDALRTSNPYAVGNCVAYTADKTDKILCTEAIQALTALYKKIESEKESYPQLWDVVKPYVPKKKFYKKDKGGKKFNKQQNRSKGNSMADMPGMAEAIAKLQSE